MYYCQHKENVTVFDYRRNAGSKYTKRHHGCLQLSSTSFLIASVLFYIVYLRNTGTIVCNEGK